MNRETLLKIFKAAPGVEGDAKGFHVAEKHRLSLYVGQPGQAMVVQQVRTCTFDDGFLQVVTEDPDATSFFDYEAIHAISIRSTEPKHERRAGFL